MVWLTLIELFFAGVFAANSIPHFVSGVCGRKFPSPFASPPGKGLSSSVVNMFWGLGNFIVACLLYIAARPVQFGFTFETLAILLGAVLISFQLASHFGSLNLK